MSTKYRAYSIAILGLFFIICSSFPFSLFIKDINLLFYLQNGLRLLFLVFAFFYIRKEKLHRPEFKRLNISSLFFLPFILLCVTNLLVVLVNHDATITLDGVALTYAIISSVFVAACEELVFRAVMLKEFTDHKSKFKSILYTSLIFGACHLLNISSVNTILPCLLQAVYTTALGFVFGLLYLDTSNIILPFALHASFNILNNDLVNNLFKITWNFWFYFLNALIAVIFAIYWIILYKTKLFHFNEEQSV